MNNLTFKRTGKHYSSKSFIFAPLIASMALLSPQAVTANTTSLNIPEKVFDTLNDSVAPFTYIGQVKPGLTLAISITGFKTAVAYLCNGKSIGVWFSGGFNPESKKFNLKSEEGHHISAFLQNHKITGSLRFNAKPIQFVLSEAKGVSDLYRYNFKVGKQSYTSGWILSANGRASGTTSERGSNRVIAGAISDPNDADPAGNVTGLSGNNVETRGLIKNIRCGILGFKKAFNAQQVKDTPAGQANDDAFNDFVEADMRATELGCHFNS